MKFGAVPMAEPVYEAGPGPNPEWEAEELRYGYESPVTPPSTYDYRFRSGEITLRKCREVLGGFDPGRYGCERFTVTAADGTVQEFGPGDAFVIPSGFVGNWQTVEAVTKKSLMSIQRLRLGSCMINNFR